MNHTHPDRFGSNPGPRLTLALAITAVFVVVEAGSGYLANSLALLTDAAHNLTDVIALALSWYAIHLTLRASNSRRTFGYHRAGILVALINSTTLVVLTAGIFYEAFRRFNSPPEVKSGFLIGIGLIAFFVNLGTALLVRTGSHGDLNLHSTFLHLMGDALATIGAVIAGVLIFFTKANWLDPLVSVVIGGLIIWNAWGILRETVDILLEATPRDVDMNAMVREILQVKGVLGVHDLHVWSITRGMRTMSAHILTEDVAISAGAVIQGQILQLLMNHYNITHATLQLECLDCDPALLYCEMTEPVQVKRQV